MWLPAPSKTRDCDPFIHHIHAFAHQPSAGTMGYIPPEAMLRESGVKVSSEEFKQGDVYSFGVLMCYILSGTNPFARMLEAQVVVMITVKNGRPAIPPHVDKDPHNPVFKDMIEQLWHRDPHRRSDFTTILAQLSNHVAGPDVKENMPCQFVRTLPQLNTGVKRFPSVGLGGAFIWIICLVCTERPTCYCLR